MRIGSLDRRVEIIRDLYVTNNLNEQEFTGEQSLGSTWCSKKVLSARQYMEGNQAVDEERAAFTIRFRPDVTRGDRLEFEGRRFRIEGTRELGRREFLELHAVASA